MQFALAKIRSFWHSLCGVRIREECMVYHINSFYSNIQGYFLKQTESMHVKFTNLKNIETVLQASD